MTRILIIEDQADIALSLKYNLERHGYRADVEADGEAGLRAATENPPGLVLLDLNLPGIDGLEVCRELRRQERTAGVPIIMLTARVEESETIAGLELGADDYIGKPFSVDEVVARVRAVLRRSERDDAVSRLESGPLSVDLEQRRVLVDGKKVELTRREFDLLADLMRSRGRVRTRQQLLEQVWGYDHPGETRTVDVHVRRLRKKLGPPTNDAIETVVGVGYRFRGEA